MKEMHLLFVCFFLLAGCAGVQNTETEISQKFDAKSDKGIVLINVSNDSRCPEESQCIWAGEVTFEVAAYENQKEVERIQLTLNKNTTEEIKVWFQEHLPKHSKILKAIQVLPYPKEGVRIRPEDYRIRLMY
jgi:CRISPR/Cas system CMR subunit Cmr4 (Cas7 group RAMP superfamily)